MIWAAISADGKSDIIRFNGNVTAGRYVAEALQPALIPFVNQHNRQMTFILDNAPGHRAYATRSWLATNNIPVFGSGPSKSPDMNPIEDLLAQLQRTIDNRGPIAYKMRHSSEELFKKNGETSTCGMFGGSFFRCAVDAQYLCRLQWDNIENPFCFFQWSSVLYLFSNKYLISFNNRKFLFLLFPFLWLLFCYKCFCKWHIVNSVYRMCTIFISVYPHMNDLSNYV